MKKLFFIASLVLAWNCSLGQQLRKGHLLGLHTITTVKLNAAATMDDFKHYFINNFIPAYEKAFKGARGYFLTGIRGENNSHFGVIWLFENEQARDRYFHADGTLNETGKTAMQLLAGVEKGLEQLGTYESKYTDWIVQ